MHPYYLKEEGGKGEEERRRPGGAEETGRGKGTEQDRRAQARKTKVVLGYLRQGLPGLYLQRAPQHETSLEPISKTIRLPDSKANSYQSGFISDHSASTPPSH